MDSICNTLILLVRPFSDKISKYIDQYQHPWHFVQIRVYYQYDRFIQPLFRTYYLTVFKILIVSLILFSRSKIVIRSPCVLFSMTYIPLSEESWAVSSAYLLAVDCCSLVVYVYFKLNNVKCCFCMLVHFFIFISDNLYVYKLTSLFLRKGNLCIAESRKWAECQGSPLM